MNKANEWKDLLEIANKELEKVGKRIDIANDDGFYSISISGVPFAENMYEEELGDAINDAWANANIAVANEARMKAFRESLISFRILNGWVHDMPSLVYSLTSVDLYFHDFNTDGIEKVVAGSIDDYAERNGEFLVHEDDYEVAEQQIYEHDELGIER